MKRAIYIFNVGHDNYYANFLNTTKCLCGDEKKEDFLDFRALHAIDLCDTKKVTWCTNFSNAILENSRLSLFTRAILLTTIFYKHVRPENQLQMQITNPWVRAKNEILTHILRYRTIIQL